ncbi:MAG TPA: YigZ family protein [Sphingobacteriaceae bacterium]|nr:YigZ family protein [Sphingobacteriaceae bacterium]
MLFGDTYKTISKPSEGIFRDRGSKFIAYTFPLKSEAELKDILTRIRSEHPKARHYCWAIRLTTNRSVFRLNDDGEPAGTAGRPILNIMLSLDITDAAVIVVRYFGGTLLGVAGLINAYKTASIEALKNTDIVEKTINDCYHFEFEYAGINEVMKIIKEENLRVNKQLLDNICSLEILIPKTRLNQVLERVEKIGEIKIKYLFTE